jgi:Mg2+ and Co2+ transporter CorA
MNKLIEEIKRLEKRIKELENLLKDKDNIINNLENEKKEFLNKNKKLKIEYNNIKEKLNQMNLKSKEQEKLIKEYKLKISQFPFEFSPGEKIMSIIFISSDQNIISSLICKNTDIFNSIENKFYEKYLEYKGLDNIFILNGRKINKNKSLDENKIKNNDIITIFN